MIAVVCSALARVPSRSLPTATRSPRPIGQPGAGGYSRAVLLARARRADPVACFDEVGGDLGELDVRVLRCLGEQGESSIGGDPVTFHQDAFGLPDEVAVDDRRAHLLGPQRI